jgi:hypothetical protein
MRTSIKIALLLTTAILSFSISGKAQNIEAMRQSLATRTMSGDHVSVTEDSSVTSAVQSVERNNRTTTINGFRVLIFSDNGQYASDNANDVLTGFQRRFPHINAYLVYESPYFKVSVGDCTTMEEAQMLMAELLQYYPRAFPRRESINLSDLQNTRAREVDEADSVRHKH